MCPLTSWYKIMSVYGISRQRIGIDEFPVTQVITFPIDGTFNEQHGRHDAALKITLMMMIKLIRIIKNLPDNYHITEYKSMESKYIIGFITIEEFNSMIHNIEYVEEPPWLKCQCDYCKR